MSTALGKMHHAVKVMDKMPQMGKVPTMGKMVGGRRMKMMPKSSKRMMMNHTRKMAMMMKQMNHMKSNMKHSMRVMKKTMKKTMKRR
jgi:hypothetical protein